MDELRTSHAARRKRLAVVLGVVAVGAAAIVLCPAWWGNDWREASVVIWLGGVLRIALIVWLFFLSSRLAGDGHEFHAALVIGLVMPLTSLSVGTDGAAPVPTTFHGLLDQAFGGYRGLAILAILLTLVTIIKIGRKSSWTYFPTLGPWRKPDAASDAGRVDRMGDAAR